MTGIVTIDQLLAEMQRLSARDYPDGMSTSDLCERMGKSPETVRKLLRKAIAAGLVAAKMTSRPSISGVMHTLPVYVPLDAAKKLKTKP